MRRLLLVGSGFSGLCEHLRAAGYDYIILKDRLKAKSPDKRLKHRVVCDFATPETVLQAVDRIKKPIHGVMTVYENYALPTAWIAEHLGLRGMPVSSMEACTDKFLMRQRFARAPEKISPDFALVENAEQLSDFAATHAFPLVLKPANLAKSLLVTKNNTLNDLFANYHRMTAQIAAVYQQYAPQRTPRIVVEEFMAGSVHSIDAFVDDKGTPHLLRHIVDYQTGHDIGFDDSFHYSRILPSRLSTDQQAALRHCAELGIRALKMRSSAAHVEVIMTDAGPRIVEIGARNGGYRDRMHRLANGIDINDAAVRLALGEEPIIAASKSEPCAVLELFPRHGGRFRQIAHEAELRTLPSFYDMSCKVQPGDIVGKAADGYKMCAVVILHYSDSAQFERDLTWVNRHVHVVAE